MTDGHLPEGDDHAQRADAPSSTERAIVSRYVGAVAWPTVALCIGLVAAAAITVTLVVRGALTMPAGVFLNSVIAYAFYTVHHDATHKAISGRSGAWRRLDAACGTIAAIALQLDHRGYSAVHLRHHAFTNRDGDPDLALKGSIVLLPLKWALGTSLSLVGLLPFGQRIVAPIERLLGGDGEPPADERVRRASSRMRRWQQACIVVMLATIPLGWFPEVFWLWFVAGQIGIFYLVVFFQWLPHFPYERQDRFGATRINRFPGSSVLLLMQDHHLIHHLYPTVPWYRYRAVFRELRPYLEERGAIIEGSGTTPHVPIRLTTNV